MKVNAESWTIRLRNDVGPRKLLVSGLMLKVLLFTSN